MLHAPPLPGRKAACSRHSRNKIKEALGWPLGQLWHLKVFSTPCPTNYSWQKLDSKLKSKSLKHVQQNPRFLVVVFFNLLEKGRPSRTKHVQRRLVLWKDVCLSVCVCVCVRARARVVYDWYIVFCHILPNQPHSRLYKKAWFTLDMIARDVSPKPDANPCPQATTTVVPVDVF